MNVLTLMRAVLRTKPTDICALLGSILTMLGAVSSPKPCVGKNKPLIVLCNSSNTVFGFSVFDAVNPNTVFDLQTPTSSHFDEGSFAVFVSRCAVKCSGCLMGQYTHRQFKLQLLNIPQPAWWSKLAQWLQYHWDLARASADQDPSNLSSKRTWCRQIWLRRSREKILICCF